MDFLQLASDRYSVREFDTRQIEQEKLCAVLEAGRLAPTAKNNQPQRIYVLQSEEALGKIRECTPCSFGAPTVLLVCADKNVAWSRASDGYSSGVMDASIVCTHMMLCAASLGLGTTWVLNFDQNATREKFSLPENIIPVCLLPIGYASKNCVPSPRHSARHSISDTVIKL